MSTKEKILQEKTDAAQQENITQTFAPIAKAEDRVISPLTPSKPQSEDVGGTTDYDYVAMYKALNPNPNLSQEQLEEEQKKQKRNKIIAAIGDGISAFSNLYFTTKGAPSMYNGKNSQSAQVKSRYDKLLKDRKDNATTYYNGLVKAKQMDAYANEKKLSAKQRLEELAYQRKKDAATAATASEAFEYKKEQDKLNREEREKAAEADAAHKRALLNQNERKMATTAKSSAEKQTKFALGGGKELAIDNNVWAGSMQQIYDKILNDPEFKGTTRSMLISDNTAAQKEDFVKQNWMKSPVATEAMYGLARETAPQTSNNTSNRPVWDPTKKY